MLKKEVYLLIDPWLKLGGRPHNAKVMVHPSDMLCAMSDLLVEYAWVVTVAIKIAQGTNILFDKVLFWDADKYPPFMQPLGPLSSIETCPHPGKQIMTEKDTTEQGPLLCLLGMIDNQYKGPQGISAGE